MRIAFCLGSLNKGGAERVVSNLANYLSTKNFEVYIIVTKLNNFEYNLNSKIKVICLDENKKKKNLFSRNISRIKKLKNILLSYNIDIVLGFLQEPIARLLILKTFSKKIKKIPIIISMRIDPYHAFNNLKNKIILPLYNNSNGFVFQTDEAQKFFNKNIQSRSIIIPNSLNPDFYNLNNDFSYHEKRIVSVGRLTKQKNYPLLINAFKCIEKKFPDYVLEIYGDGQLKNSLEILIKDLNLTGKVKLMGNVSNLKSRIENANLFVISSDYEGVSNALMESLALGIPSISTDSDGGGARELIITNYNGILVPKNNINELSKKMEYLLTNEEIAETISKNAIEFMKKFDPKIINKKWENYILSVHDEFSLTKNKK